MRGYYTHVTLACDGISRRHALISLSLDDARREAALLAAALYPGRRFTYWVRPL